MAEAARLEKYMGQKALFRYGGIGDIVACSSSHSHKAYVAGRELGAGRGIPITRLEALQAICRLGEAKNIDLPLTKTLTAIAMGKMRPRLALDMLMRREIGLE